VDLDKVPAETFYQQALAAQKKGDFKTATRLLQMAIAKAPRERRYRQAQQELRAAIKAAAEPEETTEHRMRRILQGEGIDTAAEEPAESTRSKQREGGGERGGRSPSSSSGTRGTPGAKVARSSSSNDAAVKRRALRRSLIGVFALAAIAAFGSFWLSPSRHEVDITPYQAILPVTKASSDGAAGDLTLVIRPKDWRPLDAKEKRERMTRVRDQAVGEGFQEVFLHLSSGDTVAVANSRHVSLVRRRKGLVKRFQAKQAGENAKGDSPRRRGIGARGARRGKGGARGARRGKGGARGARKGSQNTPGSSAPSDASASSTAPPAPPTQQ